MSGVEVSAEAVEAAARGLHILLELTDGWDALTGGDRDGYRAMVTAALAAAAPIILAAERERIAVAIEAKRDDRFDMWRTTGLNIAARIARTSP